MKQHLHKALEILTLASTNTRGATIESLILGTLFTFRKGVGKQDLNQGIIDIYGIVLQSYELDTHMEILVKNGQVLTSGDLFTISRESIDIIGNREIERNSVIQRRKRNFNTRIKECSDITLDLEETEELWLVYNKYVLESFYLYGSSAYEYFHPHVEFKPVAESFDYKKYCYQSFDYKEYAEILITYISRQQEFFIDDDINYLFDLSQKSTSFLSLGLPKDLYNNLFVDNIIDWVVFLDTNILYSILDLHDHSENVAVTQLINLIKKSNLPISFRILPITKKELLHKKSEWAEHIPEKKYNSNHINAALKSNKLDATTRKYFEGLKNNPDSTIHPSRIVDQADRLLTHNGVTVYRDKFADLNEEFITKKIEAYNTYLTIKNQARLDYGKEPVHKHNEQIKHDVFLREVILYLRGRKNRTFNSLNEAKYFGMTLDNSLISFDDIEVKRHSDSLKYFTFFKPSFLLSKIIKLLPADTAVDYKRAFIGSITSKSIYASSEETKSILKTLEYLKSKGIDEEQAVYEIISDSVFLKKIQETESDEENLQFIESTLNVKLKKNREGLAESVSELERLKNENKRVIAENEDVRRNFNEVSKKIDKISSIQNIYITDAIKAKAQVDHLKHKLDEKRLKGQTKIDFNVNISENGDQSVDRNVKVDEPKKPFYKKLWAKIVGGILILAALAQLLVNGQHLFSEYFDNIEAEEILPKDTTTQSKLNTPPKAKNEILDTSTIENYLDTLEQQ